MIFFRAFFVGIAFLAFLISVQSKASVASIITEVDVHADSALVTRAAEVKLVAGENVLRCR